jgi:hypothetical protein
MDTGSIFLNSLDMHFIGCICLANLKQLNHKGREDRKEKSLCGLWGSNSSLTALTGVRFTNG